MKKPNNRSRKQGPKPPKIIRHYETLTPKETDDLVDAVAELIVNFVEKEDLDSRQEQHDGGRENRSGEVRAWAKPRKEAGHEKRAEYPRQGIEDR